MAKKLKQYLAHETNQSYTKAGLKSVRDIFKTWCANQDLEGSDELEYVFGTGTQDSYRTTVEQQLQVFYTYAEATAWYAKANTEN